MDNMTIFDYMVLAGCLTLIGVVLYVSMQEDAVLAKEVVHIMFVARKEEKEEESK